MWTATPSWNSPVCALCFTMILYLAFRTQSWRKLWKYGSQGEREKERNRDRDRHRGREYAYAETQLERKGDDVNPEDATKPSRLCARPSWAMVWEET